jgi:dihydropteroate synthase
LDLSHYTNIMGILNITPDSFSDGGRYNHVDTAIVRALEIQQEGADVLDVGAQSTRPGHIPISPQEEAERLLPVLLALRGKLSIPISVDTYYPEVAAQALDAGAAIINDISNSLTNGMPELVSRYDAGLVMMHNGMGESTFTEVRRYFEQALEYAAKAGLPREAVCLDPGAGFGKSRQGDLEVVARLPELTQGLPDVAVLVGASRKRVVGAYCGNPPFEERLAGTLAIHTVAQMNGARLLRVHDVAAAVQAAKVTDALLAVKYGTKEDI